MTKNKIDPQIEKDKAKLQTNNVSGLTKYIAEQKAITGKSDKYYIGQLLLIGIDYAKLTAPPKHRIVEVKKKNPPKD